DGAGLHSEPVAVEVLEVRVVEQEKVAPAGMGTLVDDHVQARRRAQVTLVELAARSAEAEYRREAFDAVPEAVDVERAARLAHDDEVLLVGGPGEVVGVVGRD